jgi:hypothetical protein
MRMRAVAAATVDQDLDPVGSRHRRTGRDANAARRERRPVVQREHAFGGKPLEQPVVDHRLRAGVAFLARLEDQIRDAVEIARFAQVACRREQHRRVAVVTAAVHAAVVAGPVRDVVLLLHRQRVHIGAQSDPSSGRVASSRNDGDDAGAADTGVMPDRPCGQLVAYESRGAMLFEAQLGMRVEVAADVGERIRPATDVLDRRGGHHGGSER